MKDNGGAAFPLPAEWNGPELLTHAQSGMTLRDYFAGQALAGLCASGKSLIVDGARAKYHEAAYMLADAMLAERAKE